MHAFRRLLAKMFVNTQHNVLSVLKTRCVSTSTCTIIVILASNESTSKQ